MTKTDPTPPADTGGTEITRFNALRHGVLSRYTVLPWENAAEYHALATSLLGEHAPHGPTEEHLVEELAGVLWRKRRLRLAEVAAYRRGLESTLAPHRETVKVALVHLDVSNETERVVDAIRATATDTAKEVVNLESDHTMTQRALDLLGSRRSDAYEVALAALSDDTRDWWEENLAGDEDEDDEVERAEDPLTADADGLRSFLEGKMLPCFNRLRKELANRPLIREQAFGEALDPDKLDRLGRYEVHLDRKFERTLATLLRLKELRRGTVAD